MLILRSLRPGALSLEVLSSQPGSLIYPVHAIQKEQRPLQEAFHEKEDNRDTRALASKLGMSVEHGVTGLGLGV